MSEDLVQVEPSEALRPARAASAELLVLPRLVVDAGPVAVARFLEFFAARIANRRTRVATLGVRTCSTNVRFNDVNSRLDDVHSRLDDMNSRFDSRFDALDRRLDGLGADIRELRSLVIEAITADTADEAAR